MLSVVFEYDRVVSSMQKNFRAQDAVECSDVFLSAGNNPEVLKNSTEHTEPLFIMFRQFPWMSLVIAMYQYRFWTNETVRILLRIV